jgi:hypothetical protein
MQLVGELDVQARSLTRVHWGLRLLVVALGAVHAWVAVVKQSMNPDGIDYWDMGEAYFRGDWANAINAYWSPLYSWILGSGLHLLEPTLRWEFTLVHAINFLIYLLALACFMFFWRELTSARDELDVIPERSGGARLSNRVWVTLGYLVFAWTSLYLVELWAVTPDMLVSALVFLAAGFTLRVVTNKGQRRWTNAVALGFILGLGYLAKSALFPLAFVFLIGVLVASGLRRGLPVLLASLTVFLLVAAPFLIAISTSKGRFTFGEAGRITYMKHVQQVPFPHWRSEFTRLPGEPLHPTRRIFEQPAVFEFAAPVAGTYPPSYDPSYWYEGVSAQVDLQRQLEIAAASLQFYADLFLKKQGPFFGIVLLLLLLTPRSVFMTRSALVLGILAGISLAALAMYGLVLVHGRYIAPFVAILWGVALAFVRLDPSPASVRTLRLAGRALVVLALLGIAAFNYDGLKRVMSWDDDPWRLRPASPEVLPPALRPVQFAEALHELGLKPGDGIAYIGDGHDAYFARLARLKIIAEIPADQADEFWSATLAQRDLVLRALASTGATAIVAEQAPPDAVVDDWQRIGESRHYVFRFAAPPSLEQSPSAIP